MKSPFALLTSLALLSACGQTGPLYMPKAPPPAPTPVQSFAPPAPAAGVTPPMGGSNTTPADTTTGQSTPTPQPAK